MQSEWRSPSGQLWGGDGTQVLQPERKKGQNTWSKSREPLEHDCYQSNASYIKQNKGKTRIISKTWEGR